MSYRKNEKEEEGKKGGREMKRKPMQNVSHPSFHERFRPITCNINGNHPVENNNNYNYENNNNYNYNNNNEDNNNNNNKL